MGAVIAVLLATGRSFDEYRPAVDRVARNRPSVTQL